MTLNSVICSGCGSEVPAIYKYCGKCGQRFYEDGEGIPKDKFSIVEDYRNFGTSAYEVGSLEEARHWFKLAANYGDSFSQRHLGLIFLKGLGIPQDTGEALKWFWLGAKNDDGPSQLWLAAILENSDVVSVNPEEADYWYKKASEKGIPIVRGTRSPNFKKNKNDPRPTEAKAQENEAEVGRNIQNEFSKYHSRQNYKFKTFSLLAKVRKPEEFLTLCLNHIREETGIRHLKKDIKVSFGRLFQNHAELRFQNDLAVILVDDIYQLNLEVWQALIAKELSRMLILESILIGDPDSSIDVDFAVLHVGFGKTYLQGAFDQLGSSRGISSLSIDEARILLDMRSKKAT